MAIPAQQKVKHQSFGFYCAWIFSILTAIGWLGLAHFWAPAAADLSAVETAKFYTVTYHDGMILGNSILIVACAFLVIASVQMGLTLAEIEGRQPLWSITAAMGGILIAVIVFLNAGFWIGAAYRPNASPDVIVALNDTAWFGFLLGWVFLSLQMVATAIVTLNDTRTVPMIPRWMSKASIVGAIFVGFAAGPAFTKSGPFAYHGLLAFYLPMALWGVWLNSHAWCMRRAVVAQARAGQASALAKPSSSALTA